MQSTLLVNHQSIFTKYFEVSNQNLEAQKVLGVLVCVLAALNKMPNWRPGTPRSVLKLLGILVRILFCLTKLSTRLLEMILRVSSILTCILILRIKLSVKAPRNIPKQPASWPVSQCLDLLDQDVDQGA